MLKVVDIIKIIERNAPLSSALDFDNAGLNFGDEQAEVKGILLAENVTYSTIDECADSGCNLLITHHPCLFGEEPDEYMKSLVERARSKRINLYSCHTNLDCCDGGLNDTVASLIGMTNISKIDGCARRGDIRPIKLKELAADVAVKLKDDCVKYVGDAEKIIASAALCTGAGARDEELIEYAKNNGVDCIIGGESKLSIALTAMDYGLSIIDVGHYTSEIICTDIFLSWLKEYSHLIQVAQSDIDPYKSINKSLVTRQRSKI